MTDLDVIIPVANLVPESLQSRIETLQYALPNFYGRQTGLKLRVFIVEQSLDERLYYLPNLPDRIKKDYHLPEHEIRKVSIKYPVFNKSWCINVGFEYSTAPYVMIADPDMFCREDYFRNLLDWQGNHPWAFAWNELYYTEMADKDAILNNKDPKVNPHCGPRVGFSEGGLVLFERDFFREMGRANEFIEELGGIDNEMMSRARALEPQREYPIFVWHLWHEGSKKNSRPTRAKNTSICIKARKNPNKMIKFLNRMRLNHQYNILIFKAPYCAEYDFKEEWKC